MKAALRWLWVVIGLELVAAGFWALMGDYSQAIALAASAALQVSFVGGGR